MTAANDKSGDYTLPLEMFVRALPHGARLIGIDVGSKTLGLALSDVTRNIASGLVTLRRSRFAVDAESLLKLAAEHQIGGFVVGLPLNLDGSMGPRVQATRAFARNLAKLTPLPIFFWDERMSTVAAERALLEADTSRSRRAELIDKVAATLILQGALDRMNPCRRPELNREHHEPRHDCPALGHCGAGLFRLGGLYLPRDRCPAGGDARGLLGAIQEHRVNWMLNMAKREQRMLDAILLGSLSQGNAFFASTSAIAVGGLAATLGSGEKLQAMLDICPRRATTPVRLRGQAVADHGHIHLRVLQIRVGIPHLSLCRDHDRRHAELRPCERRGLPQHAERTAGLIGMAAEHTNSGIRSFYHAIATIAWFFHPLLFMLATTWVILILARRDFFPGSSPHSSAAVTSES